MNSIDVIKQFNKDYPLFEQNVKILILKISRLRFYIYGLIAVICILVIVLIILLRSFYSSKIRNSESIK